MRTPAADKVHNLFDTDTTPQVDQQSDINSSPSSNSNPADFPKPLYKINDSLISQNANIAKNKGNTPTAQDEAYRSSIEFHTQSFNATLTDVGKELLAEKNAAEIKIIQTSDEIVARETDESAMDKTVEEERSVVAEELSKIDLIKLFTCIVSLVVIFFWVEVTWANYLHDNLLFGWTNALFYPLIFPAIGAGLSLYLKHEFHALNPQLLRKITVGASVLSFVMFVVMMVFLGMESSMTKASATGGVLQGNGTTVPMWVSLIRTVSQGILEISLDFILVSVVYSIYAKASSNRHVIIKVPNPLYIAHTNTTEGLRKQKSALEQRVSAIHDWHEAQTKIIQATLLDVATRLNEKLS